MSYLRKISLFSCEDFSPIFSFLGYADLDTFNNLDVLVNKI